MSQGFGTWNEDRKAQENGDVEAGWFDSESLLPGGLPSFNTEAISWDSMKSSMEAQMPRTILGMGYQQRFQVRSKGALLTGQAGPLR